MKQQTESSSTSGEKFSRPDLLGVAKRKLSRVERLNLRLVRASFRPGLIDKSLRYLQSTVGQAWIHFSTRHLREVHGLERLPDLSSGQSIVVVANHRSFFDLYVITAELVRRGLKQRIVFLVRSDFFYDSILGFFVNFLMSFLAMYPPIFRQRKKAALSLLALDELGWMLRQGGIFAGLHPEGTRSRGDDPYAFLPAQPGVGRVIQRAGVPVIPVFVNGLGNDLLKQVKGNFSGRGDKISVTFGAPIEFGGLLAEKSNTRTYRKISERCMEAISELGEEEKALRAC